MQQLTSFFAEFKGSAYKPQHNLVVGILVHFLLDLVLGNTYTTNWRSTLTQLRSMVDSRDTVRLEVTTSSDELLKNSLCIVLHCCMYEYVSGKTTQLYNIYICKMKYDDCVYFLAYLVYCRAASTHGTLKDYQLPTFNTLSPSSCLFLQIFTACLESDDLPFWEYEFFTPAEPVMREMKTHLEERLFVRSLPKDWCRQVSLPIRPVGNATEATRFLKGKDRGPSTHVIKKLGKENPDGSAMLLTLDVGDWVLARWEESENYYNGKVAGVDLVDCKVAVRFDDGDSDPSLEPRYVRYNHSVLSINTMQIKLDKLHNLPGIGLVWPAVPSAANEEEATKVLRAYYKWLVRLLLNSTYKLLSYIISMYRILFLLAAFWAPSLLLRSQSPSKNW